MFKKADNSAQEVFTLTEGPVSISYPAKLSGESIGDLEKYLKIFVDKVTRQGDDPHDNWAGVSVAERQADTLSNPLGISGVSTSQVNNAPTTTGGGV